MTHIYALDAHIKTGIFVGTAAGAKLWFCRRPPTTRVIQMRHTAGSVVIKHAFGLGNQRIREATNDFITAGMTVFPRANHWGHIQCLSIATARQPDQHNHRTPDTSRLPCHHTLSLSH